MDGHAAIGDDRTLRRIIAALVALAAMAAAASSRSFPVRFLVLCILRHAEAVALGFVAEAARAPRHAAEEIADVRNGPADAILLAARFAALAAALAALLRPGRHCRNVRIGGTLRLFAPMPGPGLIVPAGWTRKPHDTS